MPVTLTPPPPIGTQFVDDKTKRMTRTWSGWFRNLYNLLQPGATKQVTIGGTTLTFVNGIFTGSSP